VCDGLATISLDGIMADIAQVDAVLLGRRTYELFDELWPKQSSDVPMAGFLNKSPKYNSCRRPVGARRCLSCNPDTWHRIRRFPTLRARLGSPTGVRHETKWAPTS